jgi:hypothetical protein
MPPEYTPEDAKRFYARLDTTGDCWFWTGATVVNGYGAFYTYGRVRHAAHRVAYTLAYGPIPAGMQVCHTCDNPPCCRPSHLFLGDHAVNAADRVAKGRFSGARDGIGALLSHIRTLRKTPEDRFWAKVDKTDTCWIWTEGVDKDGYGKTTWGGMHVRTHRLAYELTYGPIPEGFLLLHSCDTPRCVRPDHLTPGTQQDNIRDRDAKGRASSGDRHWSQRADAKAAREREIYAQIERTESCWNWTGMTDSGGSGRICWEGRNYVAARLIYEQAGYEIPNGMMLSHACGNPACVRPSHMLPISKGRMTHDDSYGERNVNVKLSDAVVAEIRRSYDAGERSLKEIAADYGVHHSTIWNIVKRNTWKHVP